MEHFPCEPSENCRLYKEGCYSDIHHKYFPKYKYKGKFLRMFRSLDENKIKICRARHEEIHATEKPPKKPKQAEMFEAIGRAVVANTITHEEVSHERTPEQQARVDYARELMDKVLGFET